MSKIKFTEEQQEILRSNPFTSTVTASTLSLTKEFKELFYEKYQAGAYPRDILRECGYPVEILGERRICGISYCIKKEYEENGCFYDRKTPKPEAETPVELSPDQQLKQLQQKLDYLTQEVEFLKKISSIKTTRK